MASSSAASAESYSSRVSLAILARLSWNLRMSSVEKILLNTSLRSLVSQLRSFLNSPWASIETCFHWSNPMPSISVTFLVTSESLVTAPPSHVSSAEAGVLVTPDPLSLGRTCSGDLSMQYSMPRCSNVRRTKVFVPGSAKSLRRTTFLRLSFVVP